MLVKFRTGILKQSASVCTAEWSSLREGDAVFVPAVCLSDWSPSG